MELFTTPNGELFTRLAIAVFLGALIGLERVVAGKTAGMRTYGLVSLGAALFVLVSKIISDTYLDMAEVDPLRVASQIVVGVGFLGAGLIMHKDLKLVGLTSASGLWVAAGIGMAAGFGLYALAIMATLLTLFVFVVLWFIETPIRKKIGRHENEEHPLE